MMVTKLARIAEIAEQRPKEKFTSLYHLINKKLLLACHLELDGKKAVGVDRVSKEQYEENLEENIEDLVERLKNKSYRPQPVRRVYIPKDEKGKRPLGIPSYEDKIVQLALTKILQEIYEVEFLECSYGFRPGRSCHDAVRELNRTIEFGKISYIVDADICSFFTQVDHEWLVKFLKERIADPNIIRLVVRFLKAGVMEEGTQTPTEVGTPQGAILSPLLANVYLHYALDLWFEKRVKRSCTGEAKIIRYADDYVCCFQYESDAARFYEELKGRLAKFGLQIAEDKTKILVFGRYAEDRAKRKGKKKPETFDFLGFTHYCSKSKSGRFRVKRKTSRKKLSSKKKQFTQWIKRNRHVDPVKLIRIIGIKLIGHYRYYGITDNIRSLGLFLYFIRKTLFKWLNRRSQKRSFDWEKFAKFMEHNPLPRPKIYVNIYGS
jgi:RNA-directed DNA polymerase